MRQRRNIFITFIAVGSAMLVTLVVLAFVIPETLFANHWGILGFLLGFILDTAGLATFVVALISQHMTLTNLKKENTYSIHRNTYFYNLNLFDNCLYKRRRYLAHHEGYMISLAPIKVGTFSVTTDHNLTADFYGYISEYIFEILTDKNKYKLHYKDVSYCFNHGVFLIYLACSQDKLEHIIADLEDEIYNIAKNHDIRLFVQPSFGICKTDENSTAYKLVNRANHARKVAENNFETLTYFDKKTMVKHAQIDPEEIIQAINNNEFVIYYQPKFHLMSKTFVGTEALVRWDSPKHGLLSPFQFINHIESSGLIHMIDMYVFKKVCYDLVEATKKGRRALPTSINFSLYEFYSPGFVDDIINIIKECKVNPALIEIEITETTSSANSFLAISILKKFKDVGLRILMDDFGVGFSNLQSLKKLPIDVVKIDKSFIDDIVIDQKSREVVKFLIAFCKANNLEVVAEGVEDANQVNILFDAKCDVIQGYYYAKPMPLKELTKFLATNEFERKDLM